MNFPYLWFFLISLLLCPVLSFADEIPLGDATFLQGEELTYDIAFLWFDRLASGRFKVGPGPEPETWFAELSARTLGVAAWVTRDREQRYTSLVRRGPDGRMQVLEHSSTIFKGRGNEREGRIKRYLFDYEKHQVEQRVERPGKDLETKYFPLPEELQLNDLLTAYLNLRLGFYGPATPGRRVVVPTFSTERENEEIIIDFLTEAQRPESDFFPKDGLLCKLTMDKEVFHTGGGNVYVWLDPGARPRRAIVEKVLGLGDVRGVPSYKGGTP